MMKEVELNSWDDFVSWVTELTSSQNRKRKEANSYFSNYLFRGQADSSWKLETTLERFSDKHWSLIDYYELLLTTKPQVETFTGKLWQDMPSHDEYLKVMQGEGVFLPTRFPAYEYFVYLRHHGFPSPLLDWTRSPYVAAFFAFRNILSKANKASIYAYCEYEGQGKTASDFQPKITHFGHHVRSHPRHFHQQSEYTVCTINPSGEQIYAHHEDVFKQDIQGQDVIWKCNIPAIERDNILRSLDQYNINAFSLFGTEDSLMEMLSIREILFRDYSI